MYHPSKMGCVKKLGIALDVLLIVAKDYCKIHDMDRVEIKGQKTKWKEQSNLEGKELTTIADAWRHNTITQIIGMGIWLIPKLKH